MDDRVIKRDASNQKGEKSLHIKVNKANQATSRKKIRETVFLVSHNIPLRNKDEISARAQIVDQCRCQAKSSKPPSYTTKIPRQYGQLHLVGSGYVGALWQSHTCLPKTTHHGHTWPKKPRPKSLPVGEQNRLLQWVHLQIQTQQVPKCMRDCSRPTCVPKRDLENIKLTDKFNNFFHIIGNQKIGRCMVGQQQPLCGDSRGHQNGPNSGTRPWPILLKGHSGSRHGRHNTPDKNKNQMDIMSTSFIDL